MWTTEADKNSSHDKLQHVSSRGLCQLFNPAKCYQFFYFAMRSVKEENKVCDALALSSWLSELERLERKAVLWNFILSTNEE